MRYHYIPINMNTIWSTDNTKCWWSNNNAHSLLVRMQNGTVILEDKSKHTLTIPSSNRASWYLPEGVELLHPHRNLHTDALSIIAKTWKQQRYSSVGEWINKLWYIQTMEYHSMLKINDLSSHEKTWRNLKCILLSERSQLRRLYIV